MEIYKITNQITGKCYIGKTTIGYEKRFVKHKNNANNKVNRRLYDSMNHHGVDNFIVELLYKCDSIEELNIKEIEAIKEYNSVVPHGYNMTNGGDGGYTLNSWSEKDKKDFYKKQASKKIGTKRSQVQKDRMSKAQKGKIISIEQREKISNKLKSRYNSLSEEEKKKVVHLLLDNRYSRKGTTHTNKTKELLSVAKRGKTYEEIYKPEIAKEKRQKAKLNFIKNNPRAYNISTSVKDEALKLLYSELNAEEIAKHLNISLYKMRQAYLEFGINNIQQYRRNKLWKIKHENWSLSEKLIK